MLISIDVGIDTRVPNIDVWWFEKPYSLHVRFLWFFIDLMFAIDKWFMKGGK